MSRTWCLVELGLSPYGDALLLQRHLANARAGGRAPDVLLLLQHPPTITLGRGGRREHLLVAQAALASLGIGFFEVERGGDITYHGPGQVVGYPILDLSPYGRDLHLYLRRLEGALIATLARFGLDAGRARGRTGVWVRGRKIASIGIHVSRWITRHGFALNVDMDLGPFGLIVPCGIPGAEATSMAKELGRPVSVRAVVQALVAQLESVFAVRLVPTPLAAVLGARDMAAAASVASAPALEAAVRLPAAHRA